MNTSSASTRFSIHDLKVIVLQGRNLIFRGLSSASPACSFSKSSSRCRCTVADSKNDHENAEPYSNIPGPFGVPWFGKWLEYKLDPLKIRRRDKTLKELNAKYGDIVKETIAGREIVHLFHPDYIKQVYEAEGKYPVVPPLLETVGMYRQQKDLTPGLGNSNGEEWYRLRSVMQHIMLRPHQSLDYLPGQNAVAADFMAKMDELIGPGGEISDLNRWILRWGLESAANNCFDLRMGYFEECNISLANKIIDANSDIFELATELYFALPIYKYFRSPKLLKLFKKEDFINGEACRLLDIAIENYREALDKKTLTNDRFKFLSYMLKSDHVSDRDLRTVILSVLTDTLSTTSQILLNNLYTLSTNPRAQDKAAEEAKKILDESGELTASGFNSSTYIKACMKESFRLFPVGLDILRLSPADLVIGGYLVPEGTYLCLNNYVHSLDPNVIRDPESYIPERWLRDESGEVEKVHPYLLTPFSIGRRMCAGRRFAEQELVLMISKILSKYNLEWHYGKVNQHFRLLLIPDQEIRVKFIPR